VLDFPTAARLPSLRHEAASAGLFGRNCFAPAFAYGPWPRRRARDSRAPLPVACRSPRGRAVTVQAFSPYVLSKSSTFRYTA